jgi:hypothetical protein
MAAPMPREPPVTKATLPARTEEEEEEEVVEAMIFSVH